ncbi:MAG: DUF3857 domain-containing protein [Bacteroidales bacterium]|nr:DUF3857 domain-containing protein [Bacteroidales bacterium]
MKGQFIYFISFLLFFFNVNGAEPKYPIREMGPELTKNVKAIIRNEEIVFTVQSAGDGKMEVLIAVTIMNESGLNYSRLALKYNKFFKVRNVKGNFYNQHGNIIKKLKKDEVYDVPAISGYSLYEDSRALVYDPNIKDYPFTAEYSYVIDFDGFLNYPDWGLYDDYNVSVQSKKLILNVPKDMNVRSHYQNLEIKPEVTNNKTNTIYYWRIYRLPAIQKEPFSPELRNFSEVLFLAPEEFKIGGSSGSMESWTTFGDWVYELNEERNILNDETRKTIQDLVKDAKTDLEKIEILYKYMQKKTRYVNIAVGLGGWQTEEAKVIDRLSYGDCKALSNYMQSLLKIIGVESFYTLVRAGHTAPYILSDFPMNQFNHAILCVPLESDTVWLECTNQKIPAGYIGKFTDDRDALIIKDNESKLVHTKIYTIEENKTKREVNIDLNASGQSKANILTTYIGLKTDEIYSVVDATDKDKKLYLYDKINIPDFTLVDYNYQICDGLIPEIDEEVNLNVNNYGSIMGERIIVPINLMNKIDNLPRKVKNRNNDVFIRRSSCEIDSVNYSIPENYSIESVPENLEIASVFGEYKTEIENKNGIIIYKRTLIINKGEYAPDSYEELRDFMSKISKADNIKFVLMKSN